MIPIELDEWLASIRGPLEKIEKRVDVAVRNLCTEGGYAYASRRKDHQSAAEKLETGRVARLDEFDDLIGYSIIVPTLQHEDTVLERLEKMFICRDLRKRGKTNKRPDVFRFDATRFIGRLRITEAEDSRLGALSFEIQIRTAFEHAWSVATHGPAYKSQQVSWKLERLAAQMKALVEQLDALAVAYHQSAEILVSHPDVKTDCEARAFDGYSEFAAGRMFPDEVQPEKPGLFAKNVVALAEAANWGKRIPLVERIDTILSAVREELRTVGLAGFPVSLSLFQFTIGVLVQRKIIRPDFHDERYYPPIPAALELLYPETRAIHPRCELRPSAPVMEGADSSTPADPEL